MTAPGQCLHSDSGQQNMASGREKFCWGIGLYPEQSLESCRCGLICFADLEIFTSAQRKLVGCIPSEWSR